MKCLVVGQGIAGTALAWALLRRGGAVRVTDAGFPNSASAFAAGIINPLTGKRFVHSWRFREFFPAAKAAFQAMETTFHCRIWHELPILRLLLGPRECNDWAARMATPGYTDLLGERRDAGAWAPWLKPGFHIAEIRQAARVDFSQVLSAFRHYCTAGGLWLDTEPTYENFERLAAAFDYVIFCEGHRSSANPFFPALGWQLAKGEGLLLRLPPAARDFPTELLKRNLLLAPLGNGIFWAGATYEWDFADDGPSPARQQALESDLSEILATPFEVLQRFAAIRPTVRDRRPLLGISPLHPKMVIFNGLGTKGALLAAYWAEHLAAHLAEGKGLDAEVDIARWKEEI